MLGRVRIHARTEFVIVTDVAKRLGISPQRAYVLASGPVFLSHSASSAAPLSGDGAASSGGRARRVDCQRAMPPRRRGTSQAHVHPECLRLSAHANLLLVSPEIQGGDEFIARFLMERAAHA